MNGDPAVEAAQRVWSPDWSYIDAEGKLTDAAREALKPIRARHYPVERAHTLSGQHKTVCAHCHRRGFFTLEPERGDWPCADAKDIYSSEELS